MRKLFVLMFCSVIFLFLVSACDSKDDDAVEFGEEFINELYSVDDPSVDVNKMSEEQQIEVQNEFSSYLTKDALQDLATERVIFTPRGVAFALNNTISVQNVSLEEDSVQEKGESIYFDHSFTLIFTDEDGNKVDEKEIKGQMTIINTDDGLKVKRYRDEANLVDMLKPKK